MQAFYLIIIVSFWTTLIEAQTIKKYVKENSVSIITIAPDSTNYSDLEPIGNAIGDAKIVMLGEQDHGDAPGHLAKTRLIKYLHEKKGFNVVAFEDDFTSLNYEWELFKAKKSALDSFINHVSITWTSCGTMSPFFKEYLPGVAQASNSIMVTGFDPQTSTAKTLQLLDSVLRSLQIPITQSKEYAAEVLPLLKTWYKYVDDSETTDKIIKYYTDIKKQMLQTLSKDDFWIATVDNLVAQTLYFRNSQQGKALRDRNIRDRQMAINLKWLIQIKYPNEKIIVWSHNYHVSKYSGHFDKQFLNERNTMGTVFTEDTTLMKQTYILGFTCYQGTGGRNLEKKYTIQKPKANSFERWIDQTYEYAFVDFKKFNTTYPTNSESFFMKCSPTAPFHRDEKAPWARIFDGAFYIKTMYPCETQQTKNSLTQFKK